MLFGTTSIKNVSSVKNLEIFQILEKATICSVGENVKCVLVLCISTSERVFTVCWSKSFFSAFKQVFLSFSVTNRTRQVYNLLKCQTYSCDQAANFNI